MRRGRLWLNSPQACAFSSKKNSDFYSRVEINIRIVSINIISVMGIMTNKMILRQFSFFLAPASHFYRKFFLLNDTKILGCGRESVYIGLTSTRAAHRVCLAEGKLQIKRDRKRFLFTRQCNKPKLKQQFTTKNHPKNTYHFCSFCSLNIRLLPLSSGS